MGKEINRMFDKQNFLCHIASHRPLDGACRDLFHPLRRLLPLLKAPCPDLLSVSNRLDRYEF